MEYSPNRTHYVAGSGTGVTISGRVSLRGIIAAATNAVVGNSTIDASSSANPARVTTTAAHNLETGDSVEAYTITGSGTPLNGIYRNIVKVSADEFDLTGFDGADGTTSDGIVHTPYISGEIEFRNGGATGDVLYKLTTTGISSTPRTDQGTICLDFPGQGILFDSGLYYVPTAAAVQAITIVYQGGDAA